MDQTSTCNVYWEPWLSNTKDKGDVVLWTPSEIQCFPTARSCNLASLISVLSTLKAEERKERKLLEEWFQTSKAGDKFRQNMSNWRSSPEIRQTGLDTTGIDLNFLPKVIKIDLNCSKYLDDFLFYSHAIWLPLFLLSKHFFQLNSSDRTGRRRARRCSIISGLVRSRK